MSTVDELSTKGEVAEGGFEFEASPRSIVMPNRKREEKGKVQLKLLIPLAFNFQFDIADRCKFQQVLQ